MLKSEFNGPYYSLSMTEGELDELGEWIIEIIPKNHTRIREERKQKGIRNYILQHRKQIKTPYKIGDVIAIERTHNLGTSYLRGHPYYINAVECVRIVDFKPKTIIVNRNIRVLYQDVLCRIKH